MDNKNYQNAAENYKKVRKTITGSQALLVSLTVVTLGWSLAYALVFMPLWMLVVVPLFTGIIICAVMLKRAKAKLAKVRREYFAVARQMADKIRSRREEKLSLLSAEEKRKFMISCAIRRYQTRVQEARRMKKFHEDNVFCLFLLFLVFVLIASTAHELFFLILIPILGEGYEAVKVIECCTSIHGFEEKATAARRFKRKISRRQKQMAAVAK